MKTFYPAILALLLFGAPSVAFSCSCGTTAKSAEEELQLSYSAALGVFLAEAISIEVFPSKFDGDDTESQRVQWRVLKVWKGPHSVGDIVLSETVTTCCLCGIRAEKGQQFLLFRYQPEPFRISNCSLSRPAAGSRDKILLLDKLTKTDTAATKPQ